MHDPDRPESYVSPGEKEILRWVLEGHATNAIEAAKAVGRKLSSDEIFHMAVVKNEQGGILMGLSVLFYTPRT